MKLHLMVGAVAAMAVALCGGPVRLLGQTPAAVAGHIAKARAAAGRVYQPLVKSTCDLVKPPGGAVPQAANPGATPAAAPARATWHAEPARVFDNLYFVGQSEYSAWAITTSAGIILIDAIYDYSVEDEVVGGLTALGLDPKQIKYVVISHAHSDHVGGAGFLQDRGARVAMSAADWDLLDRTTATFPKPKRDIVVSDGQRLTLGDTTITLHATPGHTLGTISTLLPVRDGNRRHMAAYWGGTAFNWVRNPAAYITPERPPRFWFSAYADSARRFRELADRAGADVLLSNHSEYDDSKGKIAALRTRPAGSAHPYVVGKAAVSAFLTVAEECAQAGLAGPGIGEQ
jgi:metallo-beta-lactamase class B